MLKLVVFLEILKKQKKNFCLSLFISLIVNLVAFFDENVQSISNNYSIYISSLISFLIAFFVLNFIGLINKIFLKLKSNKILNNAKIFINNFFNNMEIFISNFFLVCLISINSSRINNLVYIFRWLACNYCNFTYYFNFEIILKGLKPLHFIKALVKLSVSLLFP